MEPPPLPPREKIQGSAGSWIAWVFNAYLVLFAADAALTLCRPVLGEGPHTIAGSLSILFALLVSLIVSSYRGLPWRCLAPALAFSIWEGCIFLPLPAFVGFEKLVTGTMCAQLLLSAGTFLAVRRLNAGGAFFFRDASMQGGKFSLGRTMLTGGIQLFVLTPLMIVYLLWSVQIMVRKVSAGFIEVTSEGLFTEARIYESGGQRIYLLPTVHIASPGFYDALMADLPQTNTVILPEGVTDSQHLMKVRADYTQTADAVGLHAQPDLTQKKSEAAVQHCDADISDFKPATVAVLNGVFGAMQSASAGDLQSALTAMQSFGDVQAPELIEDILQTRNARVVDGIQQALPKFGHIAVPWGAAHMPGIERGVRQLNATLKDKRKVEVLRWRDLKLFPQQ